MVETIVGLIVVAIAIPVVVCFGAVILGVIGEIIKAIITK